MADETKDTEIQKDKPRFIKEAEDFNVKQRIADLVKYREDLGIEKIWRDAESSLDPRPALAASKFARDFSQRKVSLRSDDWQSDNSDLTGWQKIQVALSILSEQNPRASFKAGRREFQPKEIFMGKVYAHTINKEMFKYKIRRFVYNQGKYGVAFATTKRLTVDRDVRDLKEVSAEGKEQYEESSITKFDGPWFKPLSPWQVYWDDGAQVFDPFSLRDFVYYDFFSKSQLEVLFPSLDLSKHSASASPLKTDGKDAKRKDVYKLWFYENEEIDLAVTMLDDQVVEAYPLANKLHETSLTYAPWMLRDDKRIDGIGIPEILTQEKSMLDKFRNMTFDQVLLSIYKTFFYDGTNQEDNVLIVRPGMGQQVLDPAKVKFLEVPAAGSEAYENQTLIRERMDDLTFPASLAGGVESGRTAYQVQNATAAALRRLDSPSASLKFALHKDARLRQVIFEDTVLDSEVKSYTDDIEQKAILAVYKGNPEIFDWSPDKKTLYRHVYPELRLGLKETAPGRFASSKEEHFFVMTPKGMRFEGDVEIDVIESIIENSVLKKSSVMELANLLIPLLAGDPNNNKKPVMELLRIHQEDPNDWLPDAWLNPAPPGPAPGQPPGPPPPLGDRNRPPQSVVPPSTIGQRAKTVVGKLGRLFSKVAPRVK